MQNNDEADELQQQIDQQNAQAEIKRQALVQQRLQIIQDSAGGGWKTFSPQAPITQTQVTKQGSQ